MFSQSKTDCCGRSPGTVAYVTWHNVAAQWHNAPQASAMRAPAHMAGSGTQWVYPTSNSTSKLLVALGKRGKEEE